MTHKDAQKNETLLLGKIGPQVFPLGLGCTHTQVDFLIAKRTCCAGLSPLLLLPAPSGSEKFCAPAPPGPAIGVCWAGCGDGRCEAPNENHCNCPRDCR